jgi:hypothetical protein
LAVGTETTANSDAHRGRLSPDDLFGLKSEDRNGPEFKAYGLVHKSVKVILTYLAPKTEMQGVEVCG